MTPKQMGEIAIACVRECVQQDVGLNEIGRLLGAYQFALLHEARLPSERDARMLGAMVEPLDARHYRRVPVTFVGGGSVAPHGQIETAMERLFAQLDPATSPDEFIKAFLDIHPFRDGNGRIAFVLWNWLSKTLRDPQPLPEFYAAA